MKAFRTICILILAVGLALSSAGSVFADSPKASGNTNLDWRDQWRVFLGNVIGVNSGNVTIDTRHSSDVVVALNDMARFKILGEPGWLKLDKFKAALGGNLSELEGDRAAVLAIDVSKTSSGGFAGEAVLLVVQRHKYTGILEGNVTIGPICPVERPGVPCPVPCEAYQARKILIYDKSGTKLLQQVSIDCTGHYRVELKAGEYTVDVNHSGIGHVTNVPKKIEIKAGQTITLNIDIDTGIR